MNTESASAFAPYVDGAKVIQIGMGPSIAVEYIGNGPLVVMLHGIGGDRSTWAHQLLHLAQSGYCAAAWDARGYGDSDDYDGPLSFTDMARDLTSVLDAFAVDRAHIVGTSMGGRISLETYANFPDRFASLTLAGVHARFGAFSATTFDREHVLAELAVPTQVIGGEFDPLTPPDLTRKIADGIPGAEYHLVYDVGHLGNLENPSEFNRLLTQFLARCRDRGNVAAYPRILTC
ncbi:MAG: alpha/beta fold hydrolase [Alphaproteobacteria bacterium]|nr:alpha/beta fold hydrolase [Alphaproteobacteria bacterium]